jgi:hypothetical protein
MTSHVPPLVEIPIPIIFDLLPFSPPAEQIMQSFLRTAREIGTFVVVPASAWIAPYEPYAERAMLFLDRGTERIPEGLLERLALVEIPDAKDAKDWQSALKERKPDLVVAIRMPLYQQAAERVAELTTQGAEIIHLVANEYGLEKGAEPLFIKERVKQIHLHLVDKGLRDQVTLIAGGGIAMAEHMAKLILCGADAIGCDIPLLVAMECRVCRRCAEGISCPVDLGMVDPAWGSARIRNLLAGWHNQLLEIMGAMGIREVRRLRGEMGRAMFFEDLEKEFASLGKRGSGR